LIFAKLESPFPKDASYQICLKSVPWFWRRSYLKEKFSDNGSDHYTCTCSSGSGELKIE